MADPVRLFEVEIDDQPQKPPGAQQSQPGHDVATQMLLMALKALSQRAIIAFAALFDLIAVASAFWLFFSFHEPNPNQITLSAIYAAFVLVTLFLVRRK